MAQCLDSFTGGLAATSAVITETMHFLSATPTGPRLLAELVRTSGIGVFDLCQPPELAEAAALMEKYADTPMDFADATLVLLAEALGQNEILTLDRRGFGSSGRAAEGRSGKCSTGGVDRARPVTGAPAADGGARLPL